MLNKEACRCDPIPCTSPTACQQGFEFDDELCKCVKRCEKRTGYLYAGAFNGPIAVGEQTVDNSDNFRNENGAIIADANCGTGKINQNDTVNVLNATPEQREYDKADGTKGTASYYKVEYKDCEGNQPDYENYDPEKPCSDCDGGNPFKIPMEIVGTVNNPDTGGDFGENVRGTGGHHKGADYGAPIGTPIYASNAGKIVKIVNSHPDDAKDNTAYQNNAGVFDWDKYVEKRKDEGKDYNAGGNRLMVEYTRNGVTFTQNYMHMQQDTNDHLSYGDFVNVGDLIGEVGISGNAQTIPEANSHLHMQVVDTSKSDTGNLDNKVDPNEHIYGNIDYATNEDNNPCNNN